MPRSSTRPWYEVVRGYQVSSHELIIDCVSRVHDQRVYLKVSTDLIAREFCRIVR